MANNGDFWSGLGYLGQKIYGGTVGSVEGIWDFVAGGIAEITGNHQWAQEQFNNDWINYEDPDNWFDPDDTWEFFGDVASGIGNSLPALGVGLATGGLGFLPMLGTTFGMSFLSAGGNAVKEATKEQGELNQEAWGYGALVGLLEGGIETISTALGAGSVGASLKAAGKGAKNLLGTLWDGFKGEFIEEAISAAITPFMKRATYDKDADNASLGEILYSGIVGGVSGMITSGSTYTFGKIGNAAGDFFNGLKISANQSKLADVLTLARRIGKIEGNENVDTSPVFQEIKKTISSLDKSLENTDGKVTTKEQKQQVGYLNRKLGESALYPTIVKSTATLVADPQATVDAINNFYNEEKITVDELTKGLESTDVKSKKFKKSAYKALQTNDKLRTLSVVQALGQLDFNAQKYADTLFDDVSISSIATNENLNRFVESESPEVVSAVSNALGVDLYTVSASDFASSLKNARDNGSIDQYREGVNAINAAKNAPSAGKGIPAVITKQKDGAVRYKLGDSEVAIIKNGANYHLYDFATNQVTKSMDGAEMSKLTRSLKQSVKAQETATASSGSEITDQSNVSSQQTSKQTDKANKEIKKIGKKLTESVKDFCRQNIPEYKGLSESERSNVRMTVRQALLRGMSEYDSRLLGRLAAQSGMEINVKDNIPGEDVFYDGDNTVYVNASSPSESIYRRLLGKEMIQKLFVDDKGTNKAYKEALKNVDSDTKKDLIKRYKQKCKDLGLSKKEMQNVSSDSAANAFADELLGVKNLWEYLLTAKPTLKQRIIMFFKKKAKNFFKDKVGEEAEKWLEKFKNFFGRYDNTSENNNNEENLQISNNPDVSATWEVDINRKNEVDFSDLAKEKETPVLKTETDNVITEQEQTEDIEDESENRVRIRDSGKRYGGQNPEEQILGVEESAGQAESRRKGSGIKDSAAARLINEGRKIKVSELIPEGSENHSVIPVERENETELMKAARSLAKGRDVRVGFFVGNNLAIKDGNGKLISARAYISSDGKKVLIRGDHPLYTAEQLMRHELGHDMIAKGEVDTDEVRKRLEKTVGKENVDKVAELYAEAYAGTDMTAEKIFEEFVCDSLGDMNVFAGEDAKALLDKVIPEAKKAASESKEPSKTRGPPEGKASIDVNFKKRLNDWDGKTIGFSFVVGETSLALQKAGIPKKQIRWDASKIKALLNKHVGMTKPILEKIPQLLEDPIIVVDSKNNVNSKIIMGDLYDANGHVVTAVLLLTPTSQKGNVLNLIKISSAEGRGHIKSLFTYEDGRNVPVRYVDKKRIQSWLNVNRLQLPLHNLDSDSNTSISQKTDLSTENLKKDSVDKTSRELDTEVETEENGPSGTPVPTEESAEIEKPVDGMAVKAKAEYVNDRVFNKSEALTAIRSIKGAEQLTAKEREALAVRLWVGLNQKVTEKNRQKQLADLTDKLYEDMSNTLNSEDATEVIKLKFRISDAVKDLYKNGGHESKKAKLEIREKNFDEEVKNASNAVYDDKERRFEKLKARHKEEVTELDAYNKAALALDRTVISIRNKIDKDQFTNATVFKDADLKKLLSEVTAFEYRGTFSTNRVREKIGNLLKWYNKDNPAFLCNNEDKNNHGIYLESVEKSIKALSEGKSKLTAEELRALDDVLKYFVHVAETFNQVFINDKWLDGKEMSEKFIGEIKTNERVLGGDIVLFRNRYVETFGTPETVMLAADGFVDGFFTTMYEALRSGETKADITHMEVSREVDDFLNDPKNKKYVKSLAEKVDVDGVQIPKIDLIELYMTMGREQSWETLVYSGYSVRDDKGRDVLMSGIAEGSKDLSDEQIEELVSKKRDELYGKLDENDKKLIKMLEKGYESTRQIKADADVKRYGIENVIDDYYYPLKRKYIGTKTIDISAEASAVDRFTYASYNKHTKEHALQPLAIGSALETFHRHVKGIAYYANVSPVIDSYNKIYKMNTGGDLNKPTSVETVLSQGKKTWRKDGRIVGNEYFKELVYNIENGSRTKDTPGATIIAKVRGSSAVAALGFNPKVWFTQFTSLLASSSMLSKRALVRGTFSVSGKDVDKYSKLAELRNREHAAVKAQGVIDKIEGIGAKTTGLISLFDRVVVRKLFASCQAEVARNGGPKIGTEENKIAAGKMLDKVILGTQQNSFVTSKTAAARNGGEFVKSIIMFKSDAVQVTSRIINEKGRAMAIKKKLKDSSISKEQRAKLETELKKVKKRGSKAVGALIASSVGMLAISHAFNLLYNKDRDEYSILDFFGNLLGGLPGIADVFEYMTSGYDLESMEMSTINDLLSTVSGIIEYGQKVMSGEADGRDTSSIIKKLSFAAGQASGIPVRNVYNFIYGITKRINESAAYKIDDFFKKQNYDKDFAEEAKSEKNELAKDILEMSFEANVGEGVSEETLDEFVRLATTKYNVTPSGISKSITIDGESYDLTAEERETVQEIYSEVIPELNKLIASKRYQRLDDKQKQKEIKNLLSRYRKMGYDEVKKVSYGVTGKSASPYSGLFKSKTSSGTSSGSSSGPYAALFQNKKSSSGAKSGKKISYSDLLSGK